MSSDRRFFSGDSLAQAVNQAAQHFKLMPNEIDYKLVEKRHGFLKVRRKVVIEVSESSPRLAETPRDAARPEPPAVETPRDAARPEPPAVETERWGPRARADDSPAEVEAPESPATDSWEPRASAADSASDGAESSAEEDSWMPRVAEPLDPVPESTAPEAESHDLDTWPRDEEPEPEAEPTAVKSSGEAGHFELSESPQPASKRFLPAEGEEASAAAEALRRVLDLASLDLESKILQGDEQLEIELWGAGQKILLRDRGRLLLAIQHLLPRAIRGLIGRSVPCRVDSDNFHEIREERLRDLAQRAADDVRHRGRPKTLEPMSPDERRIVHLTLSDYPGVETESQGSGLFKRVMVRKVRGGDRPRGFDPYNR